MKKYIQLFLVLVMVFAVVGLAKNSSVWAGNVNEVAEYAPSVDSQRAARLSPAPSEISITDSGVYNIGGICSLEVTYNLEHGLRDDADINVPLDFSTNIPFGYEGGLYLPGCHIVHYKNDKIMEEMTEEDGDWKVCFAESADVELTVYYYHEEPFTASPIWIELETTHEDGFACAQAIYTGEYAPGAKTGDTIFEQSSTTTVYIPGYTQGSVVVPPREIKIVESGRYSVGGVCTLSVFYKKPNQSDKVHVADALRYNSEADTVDGYAYSEHASFPEDDGLLYLPGCHVLHYKVNDITRWEKAENDGEWEICFAAPPDKEMTIYVYLGDLERQQSEWYPLETTVKGGEACAPAFYTGVYVPAGK